MLVSTKDQHESAIGLTMPPPTWTSLPPPSPSHPSRLLRSPGLSSLSHITNFHWLSILYMVMYISMLHPSLFFLPYQTIHHLFRWGKGGLKLSLIQGYIIKKWSSWNKTLEAWLQKLFLSSFHNLYRISINSEFMDISSDNFIVFSPCYILTFLP